MLRTSAPLIGALGVMKPIVWAFFLFYSLITGADPLTNAKAECESLMNEALSFAETMLQKHGEFFPYGVARKMNDEIVSVASYDGNDHPASSDVIGLLKKAFIQGAKTGEYRATALVYDVKVTIPTSGTKSDAIAVSLNHRDQYSVIVYLPYRITGGQVVFEDVFANQGESDVFSEK